MTCGLPSTLSIAHKLRAALTVLGLTMGVATLITVMTLVQGANLYVEQKIANLGTNVFRLAKTPFAVVDFTVVVKSLKNKNIDTSDYRAVAELCQACEAGGRIRQRHAFGAVHRISRPTTPPSSVTRPTWWTSTRARWTSGRYFTPGEDRHAAYVCLIGASLVGSVLPRRQSDRPHHPHRQPGVHGHRHVSETRLGAGPGPGQLRRHPAHHLPEGARLAVQPDARNQGLRRREEFHRRAGRSARDHAHRAVTTRRAKTTASSSAPRKVISRCGRASADRSSRCS